MYINVLEYLEEQAQNNPDKIIFADEQNSITYSDFVQKAKAVASGIIATTNEIANKPIFVLINRTITSLIAFFGVIYSGRFYVPCDTKLPRKRLDSMYELLKPESIIELEKGVGKTFFTNHTIFNIDDLCSNIIDDEKLQYIKSRSIDTNIVYSMFTSGTTGIPKNIVISHKSIIDLVEQFSIAFELNENCIFGNQAPFDFDVSIKDIFLTIRLGGTMNIIDKKMFSFPTILIDYLNSRKVNTIIWSTSAMKIVSLLETFKNCKPKFLQTIMFSGEVMPVKILNNWIENVNAKYINLYGPTEITCNCTYYIVNRAFDEKDLLPIGKAFRNTEVYLFDKDNLVTEKNVTGEICVRGSSLALGYYNNINKTNDVFVQNPLNDHYPEKIYRTGDIGMYNENGEIVFVGRVDSQIKYMGNRIELGEIELALNSMKSIDFGCCIYDTKKEKICVFYQAKEKQDKLILEHLKEMLPKYMVPSVIYHFEKLPENKNGKIDRTLLKEIYLGECNKNERRID